MKIRRDAFKQHIEKILCGKQITEAVFEDGFATQALSPDHLLLVIAPSLEGVEPLDAAIGLANLPLILDALTIAPGEGNEVTDVDVEIEDERLVIQEGDRAGIVLLVSSPKTIGTRVEAGTVKKLLAKKEAAGKGFHLTRALVGGVQKAFSMFKATEIELFVGKDPKVRVGHENSNFVDFPFKELKSKESYSVLLDEHFVAALGQITDYSEARLYLGGPDGVVCVEDGEYQYLLSPKSRAADEKKQAKPPKGAKGKGKKQEEEPEPASADEEE